MLFASRSNGSGGVICGCQICPDPDVELNIVISDEIACPGFSITGINGTWTATPQILGGWATGTIGTATSGMTTENAHMEIFCVDGLFSASIYAPNAGNPLWTGNGYLDTPIPDAGTCDGIRWAAGGIVTISL